MYYNYYSIIIILLTWRVTAADGRVFRGWRCTSIMHTLHHAQNLRHSEISRRRFGRAGLFDGGALGINTLYTRKGRKKTYFRDRRTPHSRHRRTIFISHIMNRIFGHITRNSRWTLPATALVNNEYCTHAYVYT